MRISYGRMFADRLDGRHGLPRPRLSELAERFPVVQAELRDRRKNGEYGFYDLVDQGSTVTQITEFAEGLGQAFDHVLVLGIGGSALGARALLEALKPAGWNELDDEAREFYPRLTVLDNIDPDTVATTLARIDPRRVLVNVVSKSGGTAETLAQYLVVRRWLEDALGDAAYRHLVFTTDPDSGALHRIAVDEGIPALAVPANVGGRFSVLSPVGLLPAALVGIDPSELIEGARRAVERAESDQLEANPAALYAALLWAADHDLGAHIHVLMPYSDRLRWFAEWFRQLWAESLGKRLNRAGEDVWTGPTPLGAVGATDQHSQVQLFMEGPFDKAISFIAIDRPRSDIPIPDSPGLPPELAYLGGHTLGELLTVEARATAGALAQAGRMSLTIRVPELSPSVMGELLMFFQLATGYAGIWYGVNPFDQPGVELGKRLTFGALGRAGYDAVEHDAIPPGDEV
ncbi:MAG: glucose-6-phosphate isomerase [Gemmatimonadales bacterium]|jgi:glucose-6-phosphate isomerase|nr:MAG: glucose-6-phosphate isomerase [Gemmatimonadales bacterium]